MRSARRAAVALAAAGLGLAAAAHAAGSPAAPPLSEGEPAAAPAAASAPAVRPLRALTPASIAPVLERPVGEAIAAPSTSGRIDLFGKRFYIAEYKLLFEVGGEIAAPTRNGRLFGRRQGVEQVALVYQTQPDIAALQALVDRAWADLQLRLAHAGVAVTPAAQIVAERGAIFDATSPASAPGAPVVVESRQGDSLRRYLVLAPSGMKLIPPGPAGIAVGNLAARLSYPVNAVESVSLAMAVNLSSLDPDPARVSTFEGSDDLSVLSPLLEVVPAPASALVHAHAQMALVNLNEALVLAGEFGRIRPAPAEPAARIPPNDPLQVIGKAIDNVAGSLLGVGRRSRAPVTGAPSDGLGDAMAPRKRVDVVFEQDGPSLARMMLYGVGAANQAIAETLRAAQLSDFQRRMAAPPPAPASR